MDDLRKVYEALLQQAGSPGEAFNLTEVARAGKPVPGLEGLSPEELVQLNRYAQSADVPATALLAAPYEGMKAAEQATGAPILTGASKIMNMLGAPVSPPDSTTSKASLGNVLASLAGAKHGLGEALLRGFRQGRS